MVVCHGNNKWHSICCFRFTDVDFILQWTEDNLGRRCIGRMIVGFTTTCVIDAYHHWCDFESRSGQGVQHYHEYFLICTVILGPIRMIVFPDHRIRTSSLSSICTFVCIYTCICNRPSCYECIYICQLFLFHVYMYMLLNIRVITSLLFPSGTLINSWYQWSANQQSNFNVKWVF
jgi:hypothetical protein